MTFGGGSNLAAKLNRQARIDPSNIGEDVNQSYVDYWSRGGSGQIGGPSAGPATPAAPDTPIPDVPQPAPSLGPSSSIAQSAAPTGPAPVSAPVAGLQAAGPEAPTAGMQIAAPGGLRQNLGRRNLPNEISGLRVLTY